MTKAERTRNFIIAQVAPIFNKKGVHGTSLSDITSATGLTKGAVYGNFADKDALAMTCFEYNLRFLQKGLYKSLAISGTAIDKLLALINFYESHYANISANGGCPLMNSAIEADDAYPVLKQKVKETFTLWKQELTGIIIDSQRQFEIKAETDPIAFSNTFIALVEGGILIAKTLDEPEYFMQVTRQLKSFVQRELKLN
ncbi:TetR/AcrR family transcriptional regulator [Roseivirga sp.]|uniref:TetR/AcrR family transcriptional regulator n=1 Tax=Roseivirga sp. TaxID=1964215 RepID=UPI003B8CFE5F